MAKSIIRANELIADKDFITSRDKIRLGLETIFDNPLDYVTKGYVDELFSNAGGLPVENVTDWNLPPVEGLLHGNTSSVNGPLSNSVFTAFNLMGNADPLYNNQIGVDRTNKDWYVRGQNNGSWLPWRKIWDSGNSNLSTVDWTVNKLNIYGFGQSINVYADFSAMNFLNTAGNKQFGKFQASESEGLTIYNSFSDKPLNLLWSVTVGSIGKLDPEATLSVFGKSFLQEQVKGMAYSYVIDATLIDNAAFLAENSNSVSAYGFKILDSESNLVSGLALYHKGTAVNDLLRIVTNAGQDYTVWHSGNFDPASAGGGIGKGYAGTDLNVYNGYGLYFYDGVISNGPIATNNLRVLAIGEATRWTQLAFDWAADRVFFRRNTDGTFLPWQELYHSGNLTPFNYYSGATTTPDLNSVYFGAGKSNGSANAQYSTGSFAAFGASAAVFQFNGSPVTTGNLLMRLGASGAFSTWRTIYDSGNSNGVTYDWRAKTMLLGQASFSGTVIDFLTGSILSINLTAGDVTFTMSNANVRAGQAIQVILTNASGSTRNFTITGVTWLGAPALTIANGKKGIVSLLSMGSAIYGTYLTE